MKLLLHLKSPLLSGQRNQPFLLTRQGGEMTDEKKEQGVSRNCKSCGTRMTEGRGVILTCPDCGSFRIMTKAEIMEKVDRERYQMTSIKTTGRQLSIEGDLIFPGNS